MPSSAGHPTGLLIRLPWSARRRVGPVKTRTGVHNHADVQPRKLMQGLALSQIAVGEIATIAAISGENITRLHLMEMGLTPGTAVKVVRTGAFGGPLDIMVRGYRLSIRREEAHAIEVTVGVKE